MNNKYSDVFVYPYVLNPSSGVHDHYDDYSLFLRRPEGWHVQSFGHIDGKPNVIDDVEFAHEGEAYAFADDLARDHAANLVWTKPPRKYLMLAW